MKYYLIISLIFFLFVSAHSQEVVDKKHIFIQKKNIHNINYEPITGLGYSYARKINTKNYLGIGIQGAPFQMINLNKLGYSFITNKKNPFYEYIKMNIFFRKLIRTKNYFDVGIQISAGTDFGRMDDTYYFYGVYSAFFYGFKYFKIGHSVQIGIINDDFIKYRGFALMLSPIILQYTFTH